MFSIGERNFPPAVQAILPFLFIGSLCQGLAGQERVHERVEVIYQEILVRVFAGGKPVPGLRAEDFTLYEDGKPVKLSYCRELRRSLARPEVEPDRAPERPDAARPRLFLFMFWQNEASRDWPKAWDYFVREIYRPGDRVVLSGESRALEVRSLSEEKEKIDAFFTDLAADLRWKWLEKQRLVREMEKSAADFLDSMVKRTSDRSNDPNAPTRRSEYDFEKITLQDFKDRYQTAINEYRLTRLKGQPDRLERLTAALKAVEGEKWVLLFMQNERLPLLDRHGRIFREAPMKQETVTELRRFMEEIERQFRFRGEVISYLRDLRPLFVGANATYHLFLSDPTEEVLPGDNLHWKQVFSSWEGAFRQISADTGGSVADTTRLDAALQRAAEREDVYYVLTFKPAPGENRRRQLRVDVKAPGLKAVFSRKLELGELFPLKIQALEWRDGRLAISLADYQRTYGDAGLAGRLRVSVSAGVRGGTPLSAEREVAPREPTADVELDLNFPSPGRYFVEVEVNDLLTGNRAREGKEIQVAPPPAPPAPTPAPKAAVELPAELEPVMARAAAYCQRLKEAAFRFFCIEKVMERTLERNPLTKRMETVERRWEYDYQITGAGGGINEQRRLVREGARKMDRANASLETRFSSHYSVFLPVTLLALENRGKYAYRPVGKARLRRRPCHIVEVVPLDALGSGMAQGKVWIDEADGSVLQVEMNPRGVAGVEALEKAARASQARLLLEVTHQYFVARGGLRFPSMTMFREAYIVEKAVTQQVIEIPWAGENYSSGWTIITLPKLEQKRHEIEFYRLRQDYTKYRFFEVDSSVEIRQP